MTDVSQQDWRDLIGSVFNVARGDIAAVLDDVALAGPGVAHGAALDEIERHLKAAICADKPERVLHG